MSKEQEILHSIHVVNLLLRSSDMHGVLALLIGDVPRNPLEYQAARNYGWDLIVECQPNYPDQSLPRPEAVKLSRNCTRPSFHMLGDWVACGALSYLMGDYPMVFECTVAAQEVACQIGDDEVLLVAAYYGFGLSMFCYRHDKRFTYKDLSPEGMAAYCWSLVFPDDTDPCARIHSKSARMAAAKFHQLAILLWESKYPNGRRIHYLTFEQAEPIYQLARELDMITSGCFMLEQWVQSEC